MATRVSRPLTPMKYGSQVGIRNTQFMSINQGNFISKFATSGDDSTNLIMLMMIHQICATRPFSTRPWAGFLIKTCVLLR